MCIRLLQISKAVDICRDIIYLLLHLGNSALGLAHLHQPVCNCHFSDHSGHHNNTADCRNRNPIMLFLLPCKCQVDLLLRRLRSTSKCCTSCEHPERRCLRNASSAQSVHELTGIMNGHVQILLQALPHTLNGCTAATDVNILQAAVRITELIEIQRSHQLYTNLGKSILADLAIHTVLVIGQKPGVRQMNVNMQAVCKQLFHLLHAPLDNTGNLVPVSFEDQKTAGGASQIQDSVFFVFVRFLFQFIMKKVLTGRNLRCCKSKLQASLPCHKAKVIYGLKRGCCCKELHLAPPLFRILSLLIRLFFALFLLRLLFRLLRFQQLLRGTPGIVEHIFFQFICNIITEFIGKIINQLICRHLRHGHISEKADS